jgi:hypothetical protein
MNKHTPEPWEETLDLCRTALNNALPWIVMATARDPKYTHPKAIKNAEDDLATARNAIEAATHLLTGSQLRASVALLGGKQ